MYAAHRPTTCSRCGGHHDRAARARTSPSIVPSASIPPNQPHRDESADRARRRRPAEQLPFSSEVEDGAPGTPAHVGIAAPKPARWQTSVRRPGVLGPGRQGRECPTMPVTAYEFAKREPAKNMGRTWIDTGTWRSSRPASPPHPPSRSSSTGLSPASLSVAPLAELLRLIRLRPALLRRGRHGETQDRQGGLPLWLPARHGGHDTQTRDERAGAR